MKVRMGAFFLLGAVFLIFVREVHLRTDIGLFIEQPDGHSITIKMSRRDASRLDDFFRKIIIGDSFAYTLAGSKPISLLGFYNNCSLISPSKLKFVLAWKTWEKWKHLFSNSRIRSWTEVNPHVEGSLLFFMADEELSNRTIERNRQDFEKTLQSMDNLLEIRPFFTKALQNHDALIGILLGYGKENSWLFHHRFHDYFNRTFKQKIDDSTYLPPIWGQMMKQQALNLILKSWTLRTWTIEDMILPSFVGDPDSEESKQLKQEYLVTREKLIYFYKNRNFLEATLSLYLHGPQMLNSRC